MSAPPRVLRALLSRLAPDVYRDDLVGELDRGFRDRSARGAWAARRWYVSQTLRSLPYLLRHRVLPLTPHPRRSDAVLEDLRSAVRAAMSHGATSVAIIVTLALGVGANAAVFSVFDTLLLRPPPFPRADRIVRIYGSDLESGERFLSSSYADLVDYVAMSGAFQSLAAYQTWDANLADQHGDPTIVSTARVSAGFFDLLGQGPMLGRGFQALDHAAGAPPTLIIAHAVWQARYGGDPAIIGTTVRFDSEERAIIGVMAPAFDLPAGIDTWHPYEVPSAAALERDDPTGFGRSWRRWDVIGRLADGVTRGEATADLGRITEQLAAAHPDTNASHRAWVEPLGRALGRGVRQPLGLLLIGVSLVLVIACMNVANLLLAGAHRRNREVAIRAALGATRARLVRQLLAEAGLLSVAGGAAGLLLGSALLRASFALLPVEIPELDRVSVDPRVGAIMLGVAVVTGLLAACIPAMRAAGGGLGSVLSSGGRTASRHGGAFQGGLIVAQVALSAVLTIGAALLGQTLASMLAEDPGIDASRIVSLSLSIQSETSPPWEGFLGFFEELHARVEELPGVEAAALSLGNPVDRGSGFATGVWIEGHLELPPPERPPAHVWPATPGYFETLGIPLLKGRAFRRGDDRQAPGVALVNRAFVDRYLADENPMGRRVGKPGFWGPDWPGVSEIVGVVDNVRTEGLAVEPAPAIYFPYAQNPFGSMSLLVRTAAGDPTQIVPAVLDVVWGMDPLLPVRDIQRLDRVVTDSVSGNRFGALLSGVFAVLALALAMIGLYGTLSRAVAARQREIGIRRALGAGGARIRGMVIGRALRLTLTGLAFGLASAALATRLLGALLYGVSATDGATFAGVAAVLIGIALLAAAIPARRATAVDPVRVLGSE